MTEPEENPILETGTRAGIKQAAQELLRYGYIDTSQKPNIYQMIILNQTALIKILEPLDMTLLIDEVRGLAITKLAWGEPGSDTEDDWSHPLLRKQRLTLEQSLMLAILRQYYTLHEQEHGVSKESADMDLETLQSDMMLYLGESGSDSNDEKRVRQLLDNLKTHGVVTDVNDKAQFTIRPMITHMPSVSSLEALLVHFRSMASEKQDV